MPCGTLSGAFAPESVCERLFGKSQSFLKQAFLPNAIKLGGNFGIDDVIPILNIVRHDERHAFFFQLGTIVGFGSLHQFVLIVAGFDRALLEDFLNIRRQLGKDVVVDHQGKHANLVCSLNNVIRDIIEAVGVEVLERVLKTFDRALLDRHVDFIEGQRRRVGTKRLEALVIQRIVGDTERQTLDVRQIVDLTGGADVAGARIQ